MPQQPIKGDKQTLIEQGTEFKGTMTSTCPVVVNGRIEGELSAPELDVTATGSATGIIKAERLSSRGMLSGNIDAGDLYLSGAVGSKTVIKARNLEVKLTPDHGRMELTFGECILDVGDEPSKERRVDAAARPSSLSGAQPLPVTRSNPPASMPDKLDNGLTSTASVVPVAEAAKNGAEPIKSEAKDVSGPKESDVSKSNRAPTNGSSPSKPPPALKKGQRDSVPPGV